MKKELSIDFEIGFADSSILSYSIKDNAVTLFLNCWNSEVIEIKFLNFISLFAINNTEVSDFKEVFESSLLEKTLDALYEVKPEKIISGFLDLLTLMI
jgi:hypothetical protein